MRIATRDPLAVELHVTGRELGWLAATGTATLRRFGDFCPRCGGDCYEWEAIFNYPPSRVRPLLTWLHAVAESVDRERSLTVLTSPSGVRALSDFMETHPDLWSDDVVDRPDDEAYEALSDTLDGFLSNHAAFVRPDDDVSAELTD